MNVNLEIAQQSDLINQSLSELDLLLDDLSVRESANLLEVYRSINIILKAQKVMLSKPLKIVRD